MGEGRPLPPDELVGAVTLRALVQDDWPLERALSHDPDVVRWTYYPAWLDEQGARDRIALAEQRFRAGLVRRYSIRAPDGSPLGTCGLGRLDRDVPEVFYAVLPQARGRGAATEVARLLAGWALANGYREVALLTIAGNRTSERVAARAGFTLADEHEDDHRGRRVTTRLWVRTD